jgi:hypothetical protein
VQQGPIDGTPVMRAGVIGSRSGLRLSCQWFLEVVKRPRERKMKASNTLSQEPGLDPVWSGGSV